MNAKRSLAKRCVDDLDDGFGDRGDVRIGWFETREPFQNNVA